MSLNMNNIEFSLHNELENQQISSLPLGNQINYPKKSEFATALSDHFYYAIPAVNISNDIVSKPDETPNGHSDDIDKADDAETISLLGNIETYMSICDEFNDLCYFYGADRICDCGIENVFHSSLPVRQTSSTKADLENLINVSEGGSLIQKTSAEYQKQLDVHTTVKFDSVTFKCQQNSGADGLSDILLSLPKPWTVCKVKTGTDENIVCTYGVKANINNKENIVFEKSVIISPSMEMRYEVLSNSVAVGMKTYHSHGYKQFEDCDGTIDFCLKFNAIFDALNRKQPNESLRPGSADFKVLERALEWLKDWEADAVKTKILKAFQEQENEKNKNKDNSTKKSRKKNIITLPSYYITEEEFLSQPTATGLRVTITSTMELCKYLIEKFNFKYLLTGRVNQDNLEKFFGTIRQAGGGNGHPTCPTFLQLYKLLSICNMIKPPKYGNCTTDGKKFEQVITVADFKEIYHYAKENQKQLVFWKISSQDSIKLLNLQTGKLKT